MIRTSPDPEAPGAYQLVVPLPGCHKIALGQSNLGWASMRERLLALPATTAVRPIDTGDYTYAENDTADEDVHRAEFDQVVQGTDHYGRTARDWGMFQQVSDHEFLPNNGESFESDSMLAGYAMLAQCTAQPTDLLPGARYYARTHGRIRLIYVDTRSTDRSLSSIAADDPDKTLLGATQLAWLTTELARGEPLKIIFSDMVWMRREGAAKPGHIEGELNNKYDAWPSYQVEQDIVAGLIAAAFGEVVMVNGDYHAMGWVPPEENPWGNFLILLGNGMSVRATYRGGHYQDYYPTSDEDDPDDDNIDVRQYGLLTITDDTQGFDLVFEAIDALNEVTRFTVERRIGAAANPGERLTYARFMIGETELHSPTAGRLQLEVPSALNGLIVQEAWNPQPGHHGAEAGRIVWTPGILGIPLIIYADTMPQVRDRLDKLRRICRGNQLITATYPDAQVRTAPGQYKSIEILGSVYHGLHVMVMLTVLDFPRDPEVVETVAPVEATDTTVELFEFAGSTADLIDLETTWTGPITDPRVRPLDRGENMDPLHEMIYTGEVGTDAWAIEVDRSLIIDADGKLTAVFEVADDWDPNYFMFRSPGSAYTLEIPPGMNNPRVTVYGADFGSTTQVKFSGHRAFVSF